MTVWNPNIPNPADVPASDATAMQGNFSVIDSAFNVDHVNLALVTNQGFHKQVSLTGAGSSPYAVSGTQNYEYAKLLASNVRSYLEYQPSGPDTFGGNPAVVPLSFKAYVVFVPTGVVIKRQFNVASAVIIGNTATITFNENMPDAFYTTILSFVGPTNSSVFVTSQAANSLQIASNVVIIAFSSISVAVM